MNLSQHIVEIIERAAKTFVEAYAAVMVITPVSGGKSAAVGGLGALISAVWTTAVKLEGSKSSLLSELEDDAEDIIIHANDPDDDGDVDDEPLPPAAGSVVPPTPAAQPGTSVTSIPVTGPPAAPAA